MTSKKNTRYYGHIFLLLAVVVTLVIYRFTSPRNQDTLSKADEDDATFCANNCADGVGRRCRQDPSFCDPADPNCDAPCCDEVKRTGDPLACSWPQRGYCSDDQCSTIPEGVNRQRCGGPRHSWCNLCISHNCPGYGNTVKPTTPIVPTNPPVVVPTDVPTVYVPPPTEIPTVEVEPTSPVLPTQIIRIRPMVTNPPIIRYPTVPPAIILEPTKEPFHVSLPNILPSQEKIEGIYFQVKSNLLDFFSKILP